MKLNLKELISKITSTPLIVESGTSGIWTYRKWSDGTAECWGSKTPTTNPTPAQWGSLYYIRVDGENYPTGLFTSIISAYGQLACANDYVSSIRYQGHGGSAPSTTTSGDILAIRPNSVGATSCTGLFYTIGKWK